MLYRIKWFLVGLIKEEHDFDTKMVLFCNQKSIEYKCKKCGISHIIPKNAHLSSKYRLGCKRKRG